jgi:hypothetical protein
LLIGGSCLEVGVLNPSILKTERPPVTCARSNGYGCRSNAPDRAAATSRRSGFVLWHFSNMRDFGVESAFGGNAEVAFGGADVGPHGVD